jgi:S-adenosyl methyltransferase
VALSRRQDASHDSLTVDLTTPSPARIYDYYLGGKDNFPVDREVAEQALAVVPEGRELARANRYFLVRAVTYLANQGIDQFIDIGTGIPTSPNVHGVARLVHRSARVAYVDNDRQVVVHNRALLAGNDGIVAVSGDIRYPHGITNDPELLAVIDFSRPVGVLCVAVLHFVTDRENPSASVAYFRDLMAPGSHLVLSHISSDDSDPAAVKTIREAYEGAAAPAVFRTTRQIGEFFDGFQLVHPGIVNVSEWSAPSGEPLPAPAVRFLGGVGMKAK